MTIESSASGSIAVTSSVPAITRSRSSGQTSEGSSGIVALARDLELELHAHRLALEVGGEVVEQEVRRRARFASAREGAGSATVGSQV